ncbi:hypothetical protein [Treponema sp.]|uniref:hypothetical protein n=1 Tax=Treponema sp. TaxID=166 RepID=UPI00260082E2|nr:hypothetical protein [Treponema sp.]MCR5217545.1 hypothetical protein [Treponema sp.]
MKFFKVTILSIIFTGLFTGLLYGQAAGESAGNAGLSAGKYAGKSAAWESRQASSSLSPLKLIEDSMLICGIDRASEDFLYAVERFKELEADFNEVYLEDESLTDEEKAELVLVFIHDNVLTSYSLNQSFIEKTLGSGLYNCVSASLLYVALAKSAGLDVRAQVTQDHCFVTFYSGAKKTDVETTNPYGFNPGVKKNISSSERHKSYVTVPKKYYSGRKEVSEKMLAALPARNLMSRYTDASRDDEAEELAIRRMEYLADSSDDEKADALNDYILCCRNHAVTLDRQKRSDEGLAILERVMDEYGARASLQKDYDDLYYNAMVTFYNSRDFEGGWDFIKKHSGGKYVSVDGFNKANDMMILGWNESFFDKVLNGKDNEFSDLSQKEKYLIAARAAEDGYKSNSSVRELKKYADVFYNNYAICVHNEFAAFANAGDYENARAVLEEGLKNFPGSSNLKKDLRNLEKALKGR